MKESPLKKTLGAVFTTLVLFACKGEASKDAKADAKAEPLPIPPKPSNGAPVAAEFVKFVGEGEGRGVELHLYNFDDKPALGYVVLARYYAGDELLEVKAGTPFASDSDFTSLAGAKYECEPKAHATVELDGRALSVPATATRAEVLVSKVDTTGGETLWSQENWSEWPAG
ncbi:hypothetical protein G6O69_21970 [Pseudenhygromyxa sp. WMMC2535]|uniref:hypothetical protein n=1 Tax=Pseudenhygromyxa sp. WMMC2535 TaxID=2712867 RepID=UPI0015565BB8|nr:hypothetical protein [Pseudenhygromyxa sp. WMMC2535]NVB40524.1 hypothetical protein [Pseudenhygromyxa sp. WMMC2535]